MNIIAVSGKICSGKSRLARAIAAYDRRYKVYSLAALLKCDVEQMIGQPITEANKDTVRPLLQAYGATMREIYGVDVWVNKMLHAARDRGHLDIIVDDVRYPNEYSALLAASGSFRFAAIRLEIDQPTQLRRYMGIYGKEPERDKLLHHSETSLDNYEVRWDLVLDSTLPPQETESMALAALQAKRLVASWESQ